jgi:flagellar biogenesis protein FliO
MPLLGRSLFLVTVLAGNAIAASGDTSPTGARDSSHQAARLPLRIVDNAGKTPLVAVAAQSDEPLRLAPPGTARDRSGDRRAMPTTGKAIKTVVTSLAVVLGLLAALVWLSKRTNPKRDASLPGEILETLGRAPLAGRQEMQLVRVGNKLLLLSVTATSAETLTEITDPLEIDRLAGICRQNQPDSITASFREILSHHTNRV